MRAQTALWHIFNAIAFHSIDHMQGWERDRADGYGKRDAAHTLSSTKLRTRAGCRSRTEDLAEVRRRRTSAQIDQRSRLVARASRHNCGEHTEDVDHENAPATKYRLGRDAQNVRLRTLP